MVERYLSGSIRQLMERARQLRQIVHGRYPREYDGLRQICLNHLDDIQTEFEHLTQETVIDSMLQTPLRVRKFKRIVEQLRRVEGIGAFALSRTNRDDNFLNRLITEICREISFPLISPTISHMSQDYFHVYTDFCLLCVPLMESRFLLHLPDIYHELGHLLHHGQNNNLPALEVYHTAYKKSLFEMVNHFQKEMVAADRVRMTDGHLYQLQLWRTSWTEYWMQEFFCDLFGVLVAGPAFAWSHYHLCVKRESDPFETPLLFVTTHPADDARMRAALLMLTVTGFDTEAKQIENAWHDYTSVMRYELAPEYNQCYPDTLLSEIVSSAKEGIEGIGIVAPDRQSLTPVVGLLNTAWQEFWRAPEGYQAWEAERLKALRATLDVTP